MLDENGEPLSFQTEEILTLGPGCSFPAEFSYDKDEIGETYKVEMESTRSEALSSASPDLSYEMKKVKKGAIINVTNNGKKTAVFVNGIAVFFKDGKPVYSAPGIFLDAEDHIQPGDTVTNQINCSDEFDDVKFYLQGCYY